MYKFFIAQTGEREKFPSTSDVFTCLFYYIRDEPMCHKYHIEYCDDFLQQVDCKFYREILLPFFFNAKAKIERGKIQNKRNKNEGNIGK